MEEGRGKDSEKGKMRIRIEIRGEPRSAEISKPFSEGKELALCLFPTLPASHVPITWTHSSSGLEMSIYKQPDPIFPDSGEGQPGSAAKLSSSHPRNRNEERYWNKGCDREK